MQSQKGNGALKELETHHGATLLKLKTLYVVASAQIDVINVIMI